jgi:hypothetical protein
MVIIDDGSKGKELIQIKGRRKRHFGLKEGESQKNLFC